MLLFLTVSKILHTSNGYQILGLSQTFCYISNLSLLNRNCNWCHERDTILKGWRLIDKESVDYDTIDSCNAFF